MDLYRYEGGTFQFRPTTLVATLTKRRRHSVYCEKCEREVHSATVDPQAWARSHWEHNHLVRRGISAGELLG